MVLLAEAMAALQRLYSEVAFSKMAVKGRGSLPSDLGVKQGWSGARVLHHLTELLWALETTYLHAKVVLGEAALGCRAWKGHALLGHPWLSHKAGHAWEPGSSLAWHCEPWHAARWKARHPLPIMLHPKGSLRPWWLLRLQTGGEHILWEGLQMHISTNKYIRR